MADLSARPDVPASSPRVAELHQLARQDYAKGQQERASVPNLLPAYAAGVHVPEPSDLEVAISVAQQLLDSDQILSMREALRLLLRALGAEPVDEQEAARRSVDRAFPVVAAFLADEREAGK
ncbi:hypothetical protein [Streptomyces prunicolor]|uniref:Uncharacterized protein n=1 Tax=Streptomyces prunicolor TaxID=67348 RepID=A0ABU4FKD8_9ACTN|nr:hypothetical protein [Streptomyces prunicolor]MDV7221019.1 hypothetical protein [Streptomyces prunicolor]